MLRMSEAECDALLNILWEESITGLALVNADGSFRRANPSFCRIVEYSEAELKRLRFQDITDPADVQADEEMAKLVAQGEEPGYDMTKAYITKTKRHQPVMLRVTGVRLNGQFIYFVGEIAPLEAHPEPRTSDTVRPRKIPFKVIRENWQMIATIATLLAFILAKVTTFLDPHHYDPLPMTQEEPR